MSENKHNNRSDDDQQSKAELLHDLQVHQIELEMQNRQLREAQQELEEARDRYADLYDYAPVGYLTLDEKGVVLEINLTGAAMLGAERLNIVGKPFINFLPNASIPSFVSYLGQIYSIPGNRITEVQVKTKEGKPRLVVLESMAVAGEKRVCRTVMQDVTDQRRMAVALQISRSAQDALLNAIPALVFYQDLNLRYLNCSQAFADFIGLPPEEVAGKTVHDLFTDKTAEDLEQIFSSVLASGTPLYGLDHSLPDSSGVSHNLSTVLSPFRDFQGRVIGLVGVCVDITPIMKTLNENKELLIQNRVLTRGLYRVQEEERRHLARELHDELGQWFTAIQAEAQVICNIAKHEPKIHDSALAISNSASAVHEVIRGMLRKLRPTLLDELGLADSLRELQRQWCRSHPDIVCEINIEGGLDNLGEEINITVYRLIQESLNNIAAHAGAKQVKINLMRENDGSADGALVLRIEDDGVGFDVKNVRPGIGLLGMRERMAASGGEFSLVSTPGKGTQIFAKLPLGNVETKNNKRKS